MLNLSQLIALEHALRDTRVLSVFLDGSATDPASQRMWRVQLEQSVHDLRHWLAGSSHAERDEFEQCVHLLEDELREFKGNVGAPAWAAFISAERVHESALLPVPIATRAVWSTGMSVAPYLRALKELRPVVVVLVDAARADVYRYHLGTLEHVETLHSHHTVMTPSHMGDAPRMGFHSGTRGTTGHDEAQRSLLEGTNRMLTDAAERVMRLVGTEGWTVTGGIPEASRRLADRLSALAPDRVLNMPSLDIHASEAEVAAAARSAASTLRNAMDAARIAEVVDQGEGTGLGALGPAATRQTLDQRRVRDLFVTPRYLESHAAEAEQAVRSALAQGAAVEEVAGVAAEQLDARGGMAARLRYRIPSSQETEAPASVKSPA